MGFTKEVVAQVKNKSDRPVLLVSGLEIENALGWSGNFLKLLHDKKQALLVNREVLLDDAPKGRSSIKKVKASDLPSSATEFLYPDGHRSSSFTSGGGFGMFTLTGSLLEVQECRLTSKYQLTVRMDCSKSFIKWLRWAG
jgi:hypothetical protein